MSVNNAQVFKTYPCFLKKNLLANYLTLADVCFKKNIIRDKKIFFG